MDHICGRYEQATSLHIPIHLYTVFCGSICMSHNWKMVSTPPNIYSLNGLLVGPKVYTIWIHLAVVKTRLKQSQHIISYHSGDGMAGTSAQQALHKELSATVGSKLLSQWCHLSKKVPHFPKGSKLYLGRVSPQKSSKIPKALSSCAFLGPPKHIETKELEAIGATKNPLTSGGCEMELRPPLKRPKKCPLWEVFEASR